MDNPDKLAA